MKATAPLFFLAISVVCLQFSVAADDSSTPSNKYGYWWGDKYVVEKESEAEEEFPTPPPNPKLEELLQKHPSQLRELEEQYREYAIWKQTKEAARDYWTVVDAARRKARSFTALAAVTMLENPDLNARTQNPITNAGRAAKRQMRDDELNRGLSAARNDFALVMFTRPGCRYCVVQRNTIKFFNDKHFWQHKEIDIERHPDLATRFNVTTVPITILIKKNTEQWMNVAVGVESVPNIEDNTYRAIRLMNGEIKPEQFYTPSYMRGGFFDPQGGQSE